MPETTMSTTAATAFAVVGLAFAWVSHEAVQEHNACPSAQQLAAEGWVNAGSYAAWQAWKLEEKRSKIR